MLLSKLRVAATAFIMAILTIAGVIYFASATVVGQTTDERKDSPRPTAQKGEQKPATAWKALPPLEPHKDWVTGIAFSRDGKFMATSSKDSTVKIWDVAKGKAVATLKGHEGQVNDVAFSPDGKLVATAGEDKTARVWEMPRGQEVQQVRHDHKVYSVAFTPDGKSLIAGGGTVPQPKIGIREAKAGEGELRLWDPATGKERSSVAGHAGRVSGLVFTPDDKMLITGGSDNTVKFWDWDGKQTLKEKQSIEVGTRQGVYGMDLSPDGKTLAVATDGGMIKLYDVAVGKEREDFKLEKVEQGLWNRLTYSPDGKVLASNYWIQERDGNFMVNRRSLVRLWDATTGKVLQTLEVQEVIVTVAFAPKGAILAAGGRGKLKYPVMGDVIMLKDGDLEEEHSGPVMLFRPK